MNLILSEQGAKSLDSLLSYSWDAECKDYAEQKEEHGESSLECRSHIWRDIVRLNKEVEFNLKTQEEKATKETRKAKRESKEKVEGDKIK